MKVIPAIDLMGGECVRLVKGDARAKKVYFKDPLIPLRDFIDQGASLIHVVDLDAALGLGDNGRVLRRILREAEGKVQVGGGVRSFEKAKRLIEAGAERVVFGTAVAEAPSEVKKFTAAFGPRRAAAAVDVKGGKVAVKGWRSELSVDYARFALEAKKLNVGAIILTSVDKDGTLAGPSLKEALRIPRPRGVELIISGGVGSIEDLRRLSRMEVDGVIIGRALYEGRFTLKEALEAVGGC